MPEPTYRARRPSRSHFITARGLRHHLRLWGDASLVTPGRPPLLMLHGWMDVSASFQFVVDELTQDRYVIAPDSRGFGLTDTPPGGSYWFPDYLADLDALLDALFFEPGTGTTAIDLLGHSMGGNVVMMYAGIRPERIRRLINLEGFGMPETRPAQAPGRYLQWLDELKVPARLRPYDSLQGVAERLRKTNPLLAPERAAWLAPHWSRRELAADGSEAFHLLADPAHKRVNPVLYQKAEALACWERITAPLLWVEGDQTDVSKWWGHRYPRSDFDARLSVVPQVTKQLLSPAGHMLHHDQPQALAAALEAFLA